MSKKIHLFKGLSNGYYNNACGKKEDIGFNSAIFKGFLSTSPEKRCKTCENSNFFKEQLSKQEKKRVASAEELGEIEVFNKQQLCPYDLGKKGSYIGSLNCRNCEYNFSWDANKIEVKCLYKSTKQIHKTQKSLNEAIEKESDKEPLEEPFVKTYKIDDLVNCDTVHINTTETTRIFDENDKMIWVRPPEYDEDEVEFVKSSAYKNTPKKYKLTITNRDNKSIVCDIYDLIKSIGSLNSAHDHAIKKVLVPGKRGAKDVKQDLNEAIESLKIAIKLLD